MKSFRFSDSDGILSGNTSPPPQRGRPSQSRLRRASSPKGRAKGAALRASPLKWCENPPDERYSGTISLAPRIYEGGGPRSGRGSPPPQRRGKPPQSRLRRASSPRGEAEGGGGHRSPLPFSRGIPTAPQKTAPSKNRGGGDVQSSIRLMSAPRAVNLPIRSS